MKATGRREGEDSADLSTGSFPGRVFDWRSEEAKAAVFRELPSKADAALLYTVAPGMQPPWQRG